MSVTSQASAAGGSGGSLGAKTARGVAWTSLGAVSGKLLTMLSQLALGWLLAKSDFAVITLASTLSVFIGIIQQLGTTDILVQRPHRFRFWGLPVLGLSMTAACLASLLMILAAPLLARKFNEPQLVGLMWIIAAGAPINALSSVQRAWLQIQMRFKLLASVGVMGAAFSAIASVIMAWRGWGAYSFIAPQVASLTLQTIILMLMSRPVVRPKLNIGRWRYLLARSGWLLGLAIGGTLVGYGDYLTLAVVGSKDALASYFFAFNMAMQGVALLSYALSSVLMSAFSLVQKDVTRLGSAFVRSCRLIAAVAAPLSAFQAAFAEPVLRLLYGTKWVSAIVPLQMLSLGTAFLVASSPSVALIKAQGRFRFLFFWQMFCSAVFIAFVITGALTGAAVGVSIAVAIFYLIFGPAGVYLAMRPTGASLRQVMHIYVPAVPIALAVALPLLLLYRRVGPFGGLGNATWIIVMAALMPAAYILILRRLDRDLWQELLTRLKELTPARASAMLGGNR